MVKAAQLRYNELLRHNNREIDMSNPSVFISSSVKGLDVAHELSTHIEQFADCTVWASGVFRAGQTAIESLTEIAERSDFAVFLLMPDEVTDPRDGEIYRPRDNLIFELGFLAGQIGVSRTIIVVAGDPVRLQIPSDLAGVIYIPLELPTDSSVSHKSLARIAFQIERVIRGVGRRVSDKPSEYHSCFISYSSHDQRFAARLYDDLRAVGVRGWLDSHDMKVGQSLHEQIHRAIQVHDKVLLILSKASIESEWVHVEIENALKREKARNQTILFPVRLDDAVLEASSSQIQQIKEKYILDFRDWEDPTSYQRAFSRLVRDLAVSTSIESGGRG